MTRQTALLCILLATVVLGACNDQRQTPTQPSQQPAPAPPASQADPAHPLVGAYTLTLGLGSTCADLPEADRTRTYAASIDYRGDGLYVVTLSGAAFLSSPICFLAGGRFQGVGCNQFFASEDIDTASFTLENNNDFTRGGHIIEQSSSGAWLEIIGSAAGPLSERSIDASGNGTVWYCPTATYPNPFGCTTAYLSCKSDLRLTFTRK